MTSLARLIILDFKVNGNMFRGGQFYILSNQTTYIYASVAREKLWDFKQSFSCGNGLGENSPNIVLVEIREKTDACLATGRCFYTFGFVHFWIWFFKLIYFFFSFLGCQAPDLQSDACWLFILSQLSFVRPESISDIVTFINRSRFTAFNAIHHCSHVL